jgi:hypothetical protein
MSKRISDLSTPGNVALAMGWLAVAGIILYIQSLSSEIAPFDPYQIMGVEHEATIAEVKKAYRKLSLLYHPDKARAPPLHARRRCRTRLTLKRPGSLCALTLRHKHRALRVYTDSWMPPYRAHVGHTFPKGWACSQGRSALPLPTSRVRFTASCSLSSQTCFTLREYVCRHRVSND